MNSNDEAQQTTTLATIAHARDNGEQALLKALVTAYCGVYSDIKHRYTAKLAHDTDFQSLKRQEQKRLVDTYQAFPYRVFRSIESNVKGLYQSQQSNRDNALVHQREQYDTVVKTIKALQRNIAYLKGLEATSLKEIKKKRFALERKSERKLRLASKIERLKKDKANKRLKVCYGTKKALKQRQRFNRNDTKGLKQWREQWDAKRHGAMQFFGSHEEAMGNDNARITLEGGQYWLVLVFAPTLWKHPDFQQIWDNSEMRQALQNKDSAFCRDKPTRLTFYLPLELKERPRLIERHVMAHLDGEGKPEPLTIGLNLHELQWPQIKVNATVREKALPATTSAKHGCFAVDINPNNLGVAETNAQGQLINYWTIPLPLEGKTTHQRENVISLAVAQVVDAARNQNKSIIMENLDFKAKKRALHKNVNPAYARMLSAFAYNSIKQMMKRKAFRWCVAVESVSAAYTSRIGQLKYAHKTDTTHEAAAYVIARRGQKFREKMPCRVVKVTSQRTQLMWLDTPLPEDKARASILRQWLDWLTDNRVGSLKAALHWQTLVDKRSDTSDRPPNVIEQQPGGLYAGGARPTNKLIDTRYKAKLRWTE